MAKKTSAKSPLQQKSEASSGNGAAMGGSQSSTPLAKPAGAAAAPQPSQPPQSSTLGNGAAEISISAEQIAARAYEIYEREGRSEGRAMDHWLQAEAELRAESPRSGLSSQAASA